MKQLGEPLVERPLPQNLDAERSVLGAIMLDNHALNAAVERLKPEDFFLPQHRLIFNQMIELGRAQQAIDLVTVSDQLYRKGNLEAAGGSAYLAALSDGVPRVTHLEHYARIVKTLATQRRLIHWAHRVQQDAFDAEVGDFIEHRYRHLQERAPEAPPAQHARQTRQLKSASRSLRFRSARRTGRQPQ